MFCTTMYASVGIDQPLSHKINSRFMNLYDLIDFYRFFWTHNKRQCGTSIYRIISSKSKSTSNENLLKPIRLLVTFYHLLILQN